MLSHEPADRPSAADILGSSGWATSVLRELHESFDFTTGSTSSNFTYFNPPTPGQNPQPITYQSPVNVPDSSTFCIPELCLPPARDSDESLSSNRITAAVQTDFVATDLVPKDSVRHSCPNCGHEINLKIVLSDTGSDR